MCAQQCSLVMAEDLFPGQAPEREAGTDTDHTYSLTVPLPCDMSHLPAAPQWPKTPLGTGYVSGSNKRFLMPDPDLGGAEQAAAVNSTWAHFSGPPVLWVLQCPRSLGYQQFV